MAFNDLSITASEALIMIKTNFKLNEMVTSLTKKKGIILYFRLVTRFALDPRRGLTTWPRRLLIKSIADNYKKFGTSCQSFIYPLSYQALYPLNLFPR